jgi:hypothetical protein
MTDSKECPLAHRCSLHPFLETSRHNLLFFINDAYLVLDRGDSAYKVVMVV